jgi:ankyrin repeat protein
MENWLRTFRLAAAFAALFAAATVRSQPTTGSPSSDPVIVSFGALKSHNTKELKSQLAAGLSPSQRDASGHSLLGIAAQDGDLDAVKLLLAAGARIDDTDHFGPPVWYATTFNQLDTVEFLLKHGANVEGRNIGDQTSLIWAVRAHRTEMVELLLAHGADVNAVDRTKVGLLTVASLANDLDIVRLLEKAGARYASAQDEMMAAAAFGDAVHIRELIAAGTPVDFAGSSYASPVEGETPLMAAAERGQTVAVRTLLAAGAGVNSTDREQRTALFYAMKSGHRSTVDALLAAGAEPTTTQDGGLTTLMELATYMDDPDLARKFIAAGVDAKAGTGNGVASTALMQAATMNHAQVLKVVLDAGVDVNARSGQEGETALIQAARAGAGECVELLLRAGADPTVRDQRKGSGKTAREWALQFHHPDVAGMLQTGP